MYQEQLATAEALNDLGGREARWDYQRLRAYLVTWERSLTVGIETGAASTNGRIDQTRGALSEDTRKATEEAILGAIGMDVTGTTARESSCERDSDRSW